MKYDIKSISVFDEKYDIEEKFNKASEAIEYIKDNNLLDENSHAEDVKEYIKISVEAVENRSINSASEEDLDYGEEFISFDRLKDLADEEPTVRKIIRNKRSGFSNK